MCAVDMFSEFGRAVLRDFFRSSESVRAFAAQHIQKGQHIRLLNMAMFHAESSHLNSYLTSPGLDQLRADTEHSEMVHLGMTHGERRHELYSALTAESGFLANIRRRRLLLAHELVDDHPDLFGEAHSA